MKYEFCCNPSWKLTHQLACPVACPEVKCAKLGTVQAAEPSYVQISKYSLRWRKAFAFFFKENHFLFWRTLLTMNVLTDNTEVAGKSMGGEWYGN